MPEFQYPRESPLTLLDWYLINHQNKTTASIRYGIHCGMQLMGHCMGRDSICLVAPDGIRSNTQLLLIGASSKSLKSTSTDTIQKRLVPAMFSGPDDFSPQGLLRHMADSHPSVICNLPEYQIILKKVTQTGGGPWNEWVGIHHKLIQCEPVYVKRLAEKTYTIDKPFLSTNSTVTPEDLYSHLRPEIVTGGHLARYIIVRENIKKQPRKDLTEYVILFEKTLHQVFDFCFNYFIDNPLKFQLTPEAKAYIDTVVERWEDNKRYQAINNFVARYETYLYSYSCILKFSELMGSVLLEIIKSLPNYRKHFKLLYLLKQLKLLKQLGESLNKELDKLSLNNTNSFKSFKSFIPVSVKNVQEAEKLLEPCLNDAAEIGYYINNNYHINKVSAIIKAHVPTTGGTIAYSFLLQLSGLLSSAFARVIATLRERGEIAVIDGPKPARGPAPKLIKRLV